MKSRLPWWLHSVPISRFLLFFFYSIILDVQLSTSQSPHSRKMAAEATATCPKQEKNGAVSDLCFNISAERLMSTSSWQPTSAMKA